MAELKYLFPIKAELKSKRLDSLNDKMHEFGFDGTVVLESPLGDVTITLPEGSEPLGDDRQDEIRAKIQTLADDVAENHKQLTLTVGEPRRIQ